MKNKLTDLNNHLFEQLERLNDDGLSPEELDKEIKRAEAMCNISGQLIECANVALKGQKLICEYGLNTNVQNLLESKNE